MGLLLLSFGNNGAKSSNIDTVYAILNDLTLPISLNPESDVYQMVKQHSQYYLIGGDGIVGCQVAKSGDAGLRIILAFIEERSYEGYCTCIYRLIPDATLNEEPSPQH